MVQYVVVRGDLLKALKWPVGAVIAQACHACSAIMHLYHDDPSTVEYVKNLDSMHKIVLEVRTRLDLEGMTGVCVLGLMGGEFTDKKELHLDEIKCNNSVT